MIQKLYFEIGKTYTKTDATTGEIYELEIVDKGWNWLKVRYKNRIRRAILNISGCGESAYLGFIKTDPYMTPKHEK